EHGRANQACELYARRPHQTDSPNTLFKSLIAHHPCDFLRTFYESKVHLNFRAANVCCLPDVSIRWVASPFVEVGMRRREFIAFLGSMAVTATPALAQTSKIHRIGTLTVSPSISATAGTGAVLIAGLTKRGYTLGQNLMYEARGAAGKLDQLPQLMQ